MLLLLQRIFSEVPVSVPVPVIFSCGLLMMDTSRVLEDFLGRSRISSVINGLNSRSLWSSFGWSTKRNFSEGLALSMRPFHKVQHEVSHFSCLVRKSEKPP